MGRAGFLTTTSQPIFSLRKKMRLGGLTLRPTPRLMPHPYSTARALPPSAARLALMTVVFARKCVMLITSLCASRSGWLPASPNSKVYCTLKQTPAHGGGLWGSQTAPYSPLLFFLLCKKRGLVGAFGLLLIFHPCAAAALPCPPPADRGAHARQPCKKIRKSAGPALHPALLD